MLSGFFRSRKIRRLKRQALASSYPDRRELAALGQVMAPDEFVKILAECAERTQSSDAVEMLGKMPPSERSIDVLCRIIEQPVKNSGLHRFKSAMRAMNNLDSLRKHPKHSAALVRAACDCEWSRDVESQAGEAFKQVLLDPRGYKDRKQYLAWLDAAFIAELKHKALGARIIYPYGARLDAEHFLTFLERLREQAADSCAQAVLQEIEAVVLQRRAQALPKVLNKALTAERYEDVASMAHELKSLAALGVAGAASALAQFTGSPARRLPQTTWTTRTNVDYEGSYDTTVQGPDAFRSTEELGQRGGR